MWVAVFALSCDSADSHANAIKTKADAGKKGGHATELDQGMVNPGHHDKPKWFKLSFLDIREDIKEATAGKKRVMLYFFQDGCPYCNKLLQDNFGQRVLAEKTQATVDTIAINLWGSNEVTDLNGKVTTEKKFARDLKVNYTPTLLFLNEKGKIIMRVNGYYFPAKFSALMDYIKGQMETKLSFRDYYKKVSPIQAKSKLSFESGFKKPPYDLKAIQAKEKKPILVLFEQTRCKSCDELHKDVLKRKTSKNEYDKLSVALVDMWSKDKIVTPSGESTTVDKWAKKLDIKYTPSLVFFDVSGKEVFRAEAYLKAFHIQGAMAYVHQKAYLKEPNFQRYLAARREILEKEQNIKINLMD